MKKEVFTCDMCGVQRKEANHWFLGNRNVENGDALPATAIIGGISIHPWNEEACKFADAHLCGQACVHKFVDEFMSK